VHHLKEIAGMLLLQFSNICAVSMYILLINSLLVIRLTLYKNTIDLQHCLQI